MQFKYVCTGILYYNELMKIDYCLQSVNRTGWLRKINCKKKLNSRIIQYNLNYLSSLVNGKK